MSDAVLSRSQAAKCVMGSCLVVIAHPPVSRLSDIVQAGKQMPTKHLPEPTVEALDEGSRVRLARPDLLDGHTTVLASTSNVGLPG